MQVFGRRQTFWDTALQLITSQSQDSNLLTAFVRLICTAAVNFTAGMLCSIFLFAFQLPSMVMSYQVRPSPARNQSVTHPSIPIAELECYAYHFGQPGVHCVDTVPCAVWHHGEHQ